MFIKPSVGFAAVLAASVGGCSLAANGLGQGEGHSGGLSPGEAGVPSAEDEAGDPGGHTAPPPGGSPEAGVDGASSAPESGADGAAADAGSNDAGTTDPDAPSAIYTGAWSSVSFGVTTLDTGGGDGIVIAYGGYSATDADSQAWAIALAQARLASLGVGHLYAVRGPEDPDYASREIGNSELAARLATQATPATHVVVVAHSSGGFVADELFTFAGAGVMTKIAYFNLDGGSWSLTNDMIAGMGGVYFCNAHDSVAGDSENTSSDEQLHSDFPASHYFTVDADGSGCDVGAGWCLHDTLITSRPHDPTTYDLALDYTDFTGGRHVVTSYLDQAVTDGVL